MKRLLVPIGLFLVIAALGVLFLPEDVLVPAQSPETISTWIWRR